MIAFFFPEKVDCIWSGPRCRQVAARLFGGGFFWRFCRLPLVPPIHAAPWRAVRHWLPHFKKKISFYVSAFAFEDRVMLHEFQFTSGGKVHILCHLWHNLQDLEQLGSRRLVQSSRKLKSEMEPVVLLHNSSHRTHFIQCPKLCKIKLCHLKWCAIDSARRTIIC